MNIHRFFDYLTITLSAPLLARSNYFRQEVQSPTLDPAYRISQWLGRQYPNYHLSPLHQ